MSSGIFIPPHLGFVLDCLRNHGFTPVATTWRPSRTKELKFVWRSMPFLPG